MEVENPFSNKDEHSVTKRVREINKRLGLRDSPCIDFLKALLAIVDRIETLERKVDFRN